MTFVKNPELGHVKTRLASTMGNEAALSVYTRLLEHTRRIIEQVDCVREVHYSKEIAEDNWFSSIFTKKLQHSGDLGDRMFHAFQSAFEEGAEQVVIVGSDCAEITPDLINQAFNNLDTADVVIGPANDGGYYLLGMNKLVPQLFQDKSWSTEKLIDETLQDISNLQLTHHLLPTLSDIDYEEDWERVKHLVQ